MSIEIGAPPTLLSAHPETAYFWGRVVADGELVDDCVTVRTNDETAARRLAAIAGGARVDRRIREREYAHDASLTRAEDEYTVQVFGDLAERAGAALGLPVGGEPGGYRLDVFGEYDRPLLRGVLEGCGAVCYRSSAGAVGVSFVHEDRRLLETVRERLSSLPVDADVDAGPIEEASSGDYWFGLDDDAVPTVGPWLYGGSDDTGLFAPSRRRKLLRSVERVEG